MKKNDNLENNSKTNSNFIDNILNLVKNKIFENGIDYLKKNLKDATNEYFSYIEKNIKKRIQKEIKRYQMLTIALIIITLGSLIIIYCGFNFIGSLANLPQDLINLIYGFFLLLIGSIIYLIYK